MEDLIVQNLGNISLAGALVAIAFILRPVWILFAKNADERNKREHDLAKNRLIAERETAAALTALTGELSAYRSVSTIQIDGMKSLVLQVEAMTKENTDGFDKIQDQIKALPDRVWETGDPKLHAMTEELKTCLTATEREDRILALLEKILDHLEKEE